MKMPGKMFSMMTSGKASSTEALGKTKLHGAPGRSRQTAVASIPVPPAISAPPAIPVVFLGRRTLQKLYLMLHLGRMLQSTRSVRLDTVNPSVDVLTICDYCGLELREYPDSETLQEELARLGLMYPEGLNQENAAGSADRESGSDVPGIRPSIHLVDLPDKAMLPEGGQCFLVMDSDRDSLEQAGTALQASRCDESAKFRVHRIYLDIWEGARIGVRYLEEKILRSFPPNAMAGELLTLGADDRNWAAIIDNQHDDRLRLSGLTSEYRRLLAEVAAIGFRIPLKESIRQIRLADRRKKA